MLLKCHTLCAALRAALCSLTAQAQGVTSGAAGTPAASAALEVCSTTQGLLLPRLITLEHCSLAAGLLQFQTDAEAGHW
ncbi:MAG: hypothetical protein ACRYFK_03825 [Janthinobacterium lividum]